MLGDSPQPIAYFSKRLYQTTEGWPPCLWAVMATCDNLQEAEKLTLGQSVMMFVSPQVLALLMQK